MEVTQQEVLAFLYTPPSLASNERENPRFKSVSSSQVWYLRFLPYLLCWRNQEMSKLSLFCYLSPFFAGATVYMNSSSFQKVSIEKSVEEKKSWTSWLESLPVGKQNFEMYAKLSQWSTPLWSLASQFVRNYW